MDCDTRPDSEFDKFIEMNHRNFALPKTEAYDTIPDFEIETVEDIENRELKLAKYLYLFIQLSSKVNQILLLKTFLHSIV